MSPDASYPDASYPDASFEPVDPAVTPRFAGLATFMRSVPHAIDPAVDVGLCGVPFDLGLNHRTGARHGPAGVREASRLIRRVHPVSGIRPFEICNVADLGDAPINPMSKDVSIAQIEAFFAEMRDAGIVPLAVGGDHTIPLPIIRALADAEKGCGPVGLLHFDAHADTLDQLCGDKINHATFMRRGVEEGLIDPKRVVQLGLRGSRFTPDDIQYGYDAGFEIITMDDYEELGRAETIRRIARVLDGPDGPGENGGGPVYVSLDIDGLDPAYLPGTGVPEIGGLIPRDVQVILRSLRGRHLVGADISEVSPLHDPTGITCVTVANLMFELLCVIADGVAARRAG
jgi:guanidinopropionase